MKIDKESEDLIKFNIMRGYTEMPPLHFRCRMCKLPSYLKVIPKENYLYQCDNCLSYYLFKDIEETDDYIECRMKRVKFKTKEMEKAWLEKNRME